MPPRPFPRRDRAERRAAPSADAPGTGGTATPGGPRARGASPAGAGPQVAGTINRRLRLALPWAALAVVLLTGGTLALAASHIEREQAGYSGPAAARCVPRTLNVSAVLPGTNLAVSPLPDSYDASPETQISMLGVPDRDISDVSVTGTFTGGHGGRLRAYSQGDGASFLPDAPFHPGETVTVRGRVREGGHLKPFSYRFHVDYPDPLPVPAAGAKQAIEGHEYQSFHSAPELHPPDIAVTSANPAQDAPGDIFMAPYTGPGSTGPEIVEPDGQLVWMDPLPENRFATNLQAGSYEGERVLTWWQGYIPPAGFGIGEEVMANSSYQTIMHVHAGNGDMVDLHDFHLEPDGTAVFTVFNTIHCNLTTDGGPRDGYLTDASFQELDLRTRLVRREWTSVDHVPLSASYASPDSAVAMDPFDYIHVNTVDPRSDGTTLLSARNTWQLYVLDTKSGRVLASVGGKHSSVRMGPGTPTAYQHDAQTLPNGDISIFDNGGTPFAHPQSRALIIELNLQKGTDTEVAELTHPRPLQAGSQGDVQELQGGNWFVGWGAEPYFTEFSPSGEMIYDAHLSLEPNQTSHGEHAASYRGYKFEWTGTPSYPPSVSAEAAGSGLAVYASWNGSTEVARWQVLGGPSRAHLVPVGGAAKSGFETSIQVPSETYVEVQALDSAGAVIGHSAVIKG